MFLSQYNARDIRAAFPREKRAGIVRRYPVFYIFSCVQCFRNPPNADMEYRIFNNNNNNNNYNTYMAP